MSPTHWRLRPSTLRAAGAWLRLAAYTAATLVAVAALTILTHALYTGAPIWLD